MAFEGEEGEGGCLACLTWTGEEEGVEGPRNEASRLLMDEFYIREPKASDLVLSKQTLNSLP